MAKAEELFLKLDQNSDGYISQEEFISIIKRDHNLLNILQKTTWNPSNLKIYQPCKIFNLNIRGWLILHRENIHKNLQILQHSHSNKALKFSGRKLESFRRDVTISKSSSVNFLSGFHQIMKKLIRLKDCITMGLNLIQKINIQI